jgi:aminoglycoside 3-N-acetyltransferase
MVSYSDLKLSITKLGLVDCLVIAHASLKTFGEIEGGAETLLKTLQESTRGVIMPTFTYKTMITPEVGPLNNGITYGSDQDLNKMAEPFQTDLPADLTIGRLPETLRLHPTSRRTQHPILSFAGLRADAALKTQTILDPLAPIGALAEQNGWVLLLGVDHTVNTSIHYAEKLAGRRQFIRWALTKDRIVECPGFPGDSSGFNDIAPDVGNFTRRVEIGNAVIQAIPLKKLFETVIASIQRNPLAFLCQNENCERCGEIRAGYTQ